MRITEKHLNKSVVSKQYGKGTIINVSKGSSDFPIQVEFAEIDKVIYYTVKGQDWMERTQELWQDLEFEKEILV